MIVELLLLFKVPKVEYEILPFVASRFTVNKVTLFIVMEKIQQWFIIVRIGQPIAQVYEVFVASHLPTTTSMRHFHY